MECLPEFCRKRILVLGCGNPLFGDDGFGPAVVIRLTKYCRKRIPEDVCVLDAGTGARSLLFTLTLSERRPAKVIIVDGVEARDRTPGEVFRLGVDDLPAIKIDDFSMHQLPTSNLLRELHGICGVDVRIIAGQVASIPGSVSPGLSACLRRAVPRACELVLEELQGHA